jgi:hypothetical protein
MRANRNDRYVRNEMRNGLYHEGHEAPQGVVAVTKSKARSQENCPSHSTKLSMVGG